jgi:hypothetical protein
MKQFLTGAGRAIRPVGRGSMWNWLVAGAFTLAIAPEMVQAQGVMGSMRMGRASQPRPPVVAASPYTYLYATNPYPMTSYLVNPYMSGYPYMYGNSYWPGSSSMRSGMGTSVAGYGGQGYGEAGYGQSGIGQTGGIAAATLFGLPAQNGRVQWPLGLRILPPGNETKVLRDQLEVVLYFVATQAAEGKANNVFIDFGLQAVHDLRKRLRPREGTMATGTYTEAMRFLARAERGLTNIKMIETSPDGTYP